MKPEIISKILSSASAGPFVRQVLALWPALKGSLALVHKPCIRPGCRACARGQKHPAWLLSFTHQGRRKCMYVPLELVGLIRRALKNGRQIEDWLYQTGSALIRNYRQARKSVAASKQRITPAKSGISKKKPK